MAYRYKKKMGISESELTEMKAGRVRISFRLLEFLRNEDRISVDEIIDGCKKKGMRKSITLT